MKVLWGVIGFLSALVVTTVGDLVSEELRSRLDRMPYAVLRVAIRRLPTELRPNVGDEWLAELHHILRQAKGLPLTRLVSAMPYALGLLRTARRIGRDLRAARTGVVPISQKSASGFSALRRVALVGGITASLVSVGIPATDSLIGAGITTGAGISAGRLAFDEQAGSGNPKPTFREPRTFGGQGPSVQSGRRVKVVCRLYFPHGPLSTQPGWWYLIASSPWNQQYYTVANSYLNGDAPGGPYFTAVDSRVPAC